MEILLVVIILVGIVLMVRQRYVLSRQLLACELNMAAQLREIKDLLSKKDSADEETDRSA